ncbi:MAG: histidine phosphatase family protein [Planctomycetes bacterium]|nr:histidine phosphatase family protein [Planctomycetota bacterium]
MPRGWLTADDLVRWRSRYDVAEVMAGDFELGAVDWKSCLSSDLPRTRATAAAVFPGPVTATDLLREPEFARFATRRLRMPIRAWQILMHLAWLTGHASQRAKRDDFRRRVTCVADRLTAESQDTLVVSHAGMMAYLSRELLRRGFQGPKLRIAKHAVVYVYKRAGNETNCVEETGG